MEICIDEFVFVILATTGHGNEYARRPNDADGHGSTDETGTTTATNY